METAYHKADDAIKSWSTEYAALSRIIEEAERIRPRWSRLREFLDMAQSLSQPEATAGEESAAPSAVTAISSHPTGSLKDLSIADAAELALKDQPEGMHLRKLTTRMQQLGWNGSGNQNTDMESIRKSLRRKRKPERFRNLGGNVWTLSSSKEGLRPVGAAQ